MDLIRTSEQKHTKTVDSYNPDISMPVAIKTKHLNLGVLITRNSLTLAMTSNKSFTKKKELIKWHNTILPENLKLDSDDFPAFLGGCLDNFLGNKKKISIWCAINSSNLTIKNITIPNLSKGKIANAAFWGFKKETEFNENQEIFSFEILDTIKKDGVKKKNILVFSAPRDEIQTLKKTFKKAGYFLTGITAIPFAMQNFIKTEQIQMDEPYFAIVNISREISEIYCFSQSGILLGRTLRTGSQSLIDELDKSLNMDPIDYLSSMTKIDGDKFSQIKDMSTRMISKIARTGDYCSQYYTGNTPITRYLFYGETDYCKPFMHLISTMIPASIDLLEPIRDNLTDSIEVQIPQDAKQRNSVLSAFGISLSANNITPNFLFTFDDQQKIKKQTRILKATVLAGITLFMACFAIHFYMNKTNISSLAALTQLNQKIQKFGEIPKEYITEAIEDAQAKNLQKKKYIANYIPLAVIYDICHLTPAHIYLTSMTYELKKEKKNQDDIEDIDDTENTDDIENEDKTENQYNISRKVHINGQVSGHPYMLDSEFDNYILKLSESPVFGNIEITSKQIKLIDEKKQLFFKTALEVH